MNLDRATNSSVSLYTPDTWVILLLDSPEYDKIYKVFAGWYGGYTQGDSWKLSSGIVDFVDKEVLYSSLQDSGSTYNLYKTSEGMSGYQSVLLARWMKNLQEQRIILKVITVEELMKGIV